MAERQSRWQVGAASSGREAAANATVSATTSRASTNPAAVRSEAPRRVARGWRFASRAGGGRPRGFLWFWRLYEHISLPGMHPQPIPGAPAGIFLVRVKRYIGPPATLPDGTHIARGDLVGELHVANARIPDMASRAGAFELLRMMAADRGALATRVDRSPPNEPVAQIRALHGVTLHGVTLLGRGAGRLGFTVRERRQTLIAWLDRLFMTGLLALYSPQGLGRLARGRTYGSYPTVVWMSRTTLLQRYAPHDTSANG